MRLRRHSLCRLLARAACAGAVSVAILMSLTALPGTVLGAGHRQATASASYMTGIGDENLRMFSDPLWRQLHTKIARYVVPYDAATRPYSLQRAAAWIHAAESQHVQILVAFYHSAYTPTKLPSVALYQKAVQKFVKLFPRVKQYQSWDESNRGNVRGSFSSPSASAAARYYQALIRVCSRCTVVGLDVLDAANIAPTLRYISEFKSEIGHLRTVMPAIWGLHNYSDVNRLESSRTRQIVRALGGQVWLTETGGLVKFLPSFPNVRGSGLARAAKVTGFVFRLSSSMPQIKRLYIFDWTGGAGSARFDAGLMDAHDKPRLSYVVVCRALHAANCQVKVSQR